MMFNEVAPYENFDLKCFRSLPDGRWEAGLLKMLWGKARVRIALAPTDDQPDGWLPIDYWGGDHKTASILLGFLLAIMTSLPESIDEDELIDVFPQQNDKDMGPEFWSRLFQAATEARSIWGDFQE
jgi:hypothetical protein